MSVLCFGRPVYRVGYVGWGSPGFFSMLNSVADELLEHVYRGERPANVLEFYAGTKYLGYGNVSLAEHFSPWSCHAEHVDEQDALYWAVPLLLRAPRYTVASRLVHILYRPRVPILSTSAFPYSLAVQLRCGDKLTETCNSEKIQIWSVDQVVSASAAAVEQSRLGIERAIFLASDGNAFAARVQARMTKTLGLKVVRHDNGTLSPFDSCDGTCIVPLLKLAMEFAQAKVLIISTTSNMGSFLLSWWGAANNDMVPLLVDIDAKIRRDQLNKGMYFCALSWGSRHGLCESNYSIPGDIVGSRRLAVEHAGFHASPTQPVRKRRAHGVQVEEHSSEGNRNTINRPCTERSQVEAALTRVLCAGHVGYESLPPVITRDGVVGLFSQLNQIAQELLVRAYRGDGPRNLHDLYENVSLVGYGGQSLAAHFDTSLGCPATSGFKHVTCGLTVSDAVATLRRAPRYEVTGALLRLAFKPLSPATLVADATTRFDLAVHVRRGDRLLQWRPVERIEDWEEGALLKQMLAMLGLSSEPSTVAASTGAASAVTTSTANVGEATRRGRRPLVLLASDDNNYLHRLASLARRASLRVVLLGNKYEAFDASNQSMESAKVCSSACVPPLLGMLDPFGRADRLILSSKSNLGGYLLSWWAAANAGRTAPVAFHDLDNVLRAESLPRRYFCELHWGTRRGLCSSDQSACDLKRNLQSKDCQQALNKTNH